ncbi:MAG: sialate O-acetylesterase, partial [Pirellulaceae bacterium]
ESDSSARLADAYEAKLHALITRLRKDFDAAEVPFLAGQMGQFAERPWDEHKKRVDAAHRGLPKKVPHSAFVSSDVLTDKDGVHFDSPSYRELGRRYAKALLELTKQ